MSGELKIWPFRKKSYSNFQVNTIWTSNIHKISEKKMNFALLSYIGNNNNMELT